ncbi:MAG: glycosyltransferase [Candidatus Eisenbacteria bacterium]|nr:glycosyltransferase [Candidatus Eisenbacteria bacterium]
MKVALYYPWVYLKSGAERMVVELTGRSRHHWTIFTNRYARHDTYPELLQRDVVELNPVSVRRSVVPAGQAALRILTQRLPLEGYDALVVLTDGLGDLAVLRNVPVPSICLCMTPLRIAFDPAYRGRYFQSCGPWTAAVVRAAAAAFRVVDRHAWNRYDHILSISGEVTRRIVEGRLAAAGRVETVRLGVGFDPEPAPGPLGDFFLIPGRIMWTKNIDLGIAAFRRFRETSPRGRDFRLVVAGHVDRKSVAYLDRLKAGLGADSGVEFAPSPSDAELRALYRSCYGVLFTAFNEDWGMIPVEAMAFGKPVVATDRGGPRETVLHGATGFLESPEPEAFAARMAELAEDPGKARAMGAAGLERSRLFTWDGFVSRMDDCVETLASERNAARANGRVAQLAGSPGAGS